MKKRNYWPLFFIGIFSFVLYMIVWTIIQSTKAPVIADKSFLLKYQDVDENYNTIMQANEKFLSKYSLSFVLNDKNFGLTTQDIRYGRRVIEEHSAHKNSLRLPDNVLKIIATSKNSNKRQDVDINLALTKAMTNDSDIVLKTEDFASINGEYISNFEVNKETNWNITGSLKVNDNIAYIFIKTNAK